MFRCPDCGRVKKFNRWIKVDEKVKKEVEGYKGEVAIVLVKCPMCKVKKENTCLHYSVRQ